MRTPKRSYLAVAGLAALALAATACGSSGGSSSGGSSSGSGVSVSNGLQALNPGGTPKAGGTLNMLGVGDVDYMDYNISYYTVGYQGQRMWVRGLYAYPAIPGKTTTPMPDLATSAPVVSDNGLKYTVTIRTGAKWDTTPTFTPVTAADAVRGLKRSCNPVQPFGGLPDFEGIIKGYAAFCAGFKATTVSGIKNYVNGHNITGVTASGQTITYTLTQPASYFADMLTLPPFNPAPAQSLNYLPASAQSYQNTVADGPYKVQSYTPTKKIVFVRNPAWSASTDPIRKAYVNQMNISETGDPTTIQQELQTNTAAASMQWDASTPVGAVPGLIAQMQSGQTKNFNLGPQRGAGQGPGPPGAQLRHQPGAPDPGQQRPDREPGPDEHPADRHQRLAGHARQLQPVPLQPDQGEVPAGVGRVPERADPEDALPASGDSLAEDVPDHPGRPGQDRRHGQGHRGADRRLLREVP